MLAITDLTSNGELARQRAAKMFDELSLQDARIPFLLAFRESQLAMARRDFAETLELSAALRPLAAAAGALRRWTAQTYSAALGSGDLNQAVQVAEQGADAYRIAGNMGVVELMEMVQARVIWRRESSVAFEKRLAGRPAGPSLTLVRAEVALEAGQFEAALEALPSPSHPTFGNPSRLAALLGLRCRILLAIGDSGARAAFDEFWEHSTPDPTAFTFALAGFDDTLCVFGSRALLERIEEGVEPMDQWRESSVGTGADYLRGAIALTLDRVDGAERWFDIGLEWASKWGVDTITGRNLYGLAEVAERRGDHTVAMEHLNAAGALFAKRGAKLYLDQVIAKKQVLGA